MKKQFEVGHYIKQGDLFGIVYIGFEVQGKSQPKFPFVKIKFDKQYTYKQLYDMGFELSFYYRERAYWIFKVNEKEMVVPELNRLKKLGFIIKENSPEFMKFMAHYI